MTTSRTSPRLPPRSAASATRFVATRTTASSRGRAASSTTIRCPACCTWRSCGRRCRTPASSRSTRPRRPRSTASSRSSPASCSRIQPRVDADAVGRHAGRARHRQGALPGSGGRRGRRRPIPTSRGTRSSSSTSTTTSSRRSRRPSNRSATDAVLIRDDKEGQTVNLVYEWESGDERGDRSRVRQGRSRRDAGDVYPRSHPSPLETCGCLADVDTRHRPGHDVHDVAGAARDPHRVRDGRRPARAEHPGHQSRPRRRLRQQGAGVPGLRRRDRGVAASSASRSSGSRPAPRTSSRPASRATTT